MNSMHSGEAHRHHENEIDLLGLFYQFLEQKWLIIIITSICLGLGILFTYVRAPEYQANALIQVDGNRSTASNMLSTMLLNQGGQDKTTAIEMALIKSRFILEPVIQALNLDVSLKPQENIVKKLFTPSQAKADIKLFQVSTSDFDEPFRLVYDSNSHISLYHNSKKPLLQGQIGHILKSSDNSIWLQVNKINAPLGTAFTIHKSSMAETIKTLTKQITVVDLGSQQKIGRMETGILDISYQDKHPEQAMRIINEIAKATQTKDVEKKSLEASMTLKFLHQQVPLAKKFLEKAELKLNRYRAKSKKIDIKLQTQALLHRISGLDKKLQTLHLNKIDMEQRYTSEHPILIALNHQIAGVERDLKKLQIELRKIPESDQVAFSLMRDVKVKNTLYTALLKKIHEFQVIKGGTISNVQVLSFAKLPHKALPSKNSLIYFASFILGLIVSALIIYGRKLLFPRVEDPHWTERHLNLINLAIIPYAKEQGNNQQQLIGDKKNISLLAHVNPRNLSIESLRSLRTALQLNLKCSNNNIISIMGACPSVGKTFVSTNLAYLLATANQRVLLIDADLRKGTVHKYFNLPPSEGFAELIQKSITSDIALKKSNHPNLTVLPRGKYPDDPSELLGSTHCKDLIQYFSQQFDIIIIDTPPILLVTDAVLIGSMSGTSYLVLGSKIHLPSEIEMVVKRLRSAGVNLNGTIFNFHNADSQKGYYYGYYESYYAEDETNNNRHIKKKLTVA